MIKFKSVTKKFGEKVVLNNLSFEVNQGEIVFILGTSGTGKSVLLKNIVGLLRPEKGEIWIDQQEVTQISEVDYLPIRKKCGMVFQHPALFDSLSVFDNVAFGIRKHLNLNEEEIKTKVQHSLGLVNLSNIENKLPNQISYGMQKRVSLARTIAVDPKILLFDEPTTGLDPVTTNAVNTLIQTLSKKLKTTSIVVSHDIHCALAIANKIIVLDKGQIAFEGSVDEIKNSQHPLVQDFMLEVQQ